MSVVDLKKLNKNRGILGSEKRKNIMAVEWRIVIKLHKCFLKHDVL